MTKQLILSIDDVLKKYQFNGHGFTWKRRHGQFIDLIEIQVSKSKDMLAINIGVAEEFVVRTCWDINDIETIDEPSCTVRSRLGALVYGRDVWWRLSNDDNESLLDGLENFGIQFIQNNHNLERMIEFLENNPATRLYPPGTIYVALLYYRKGETEFSRELLKSMKLSGAWSKKASDILEALD